MTKRDWFYILSVLVVSLCSRTRIAFAQRAGGGDSTFQFNIPAQPMATALVAYSSLTGWTVSVDSVDLTIVRASHAVIGRFTAQEGLRQMLTGTGLAFRVEAPSSYE